MNKLIKYTASFGIALLACLMHSCSDDTFVQQDTSFKEGAPLNMGISFGETIKTRLAELPNAEAMNKDEKGLLHVGLYIYYKDDYAAGNLSKPYIRNLKCKVASGCLVPESGEPNIYIYDRMTVVAFYPYNAEMSLPANFFTAKQHEEAYPISRSDYSTQTYIPYRAQLDTDPTIAYLAQLWFQPKHTAKIEIVLVADNEADFPKANVNLKILPEVDPVDPVGGGDGYTTDKREAWYDGINKYPKESSIPVGGKYARQYVAYIWKSKKDDPHHDNTTPLQPGTGADDDRNHWDNIIKEGEIVFTSDKLTLLSSQRVDLNEQQVYRYGYNLNTGEIFIPTSSMLVHDAKSLQDASFNKSNAYQVCDIDLSNFAWKPKSIIDASFDGGGHQIKNLNINATAADGVADTPVKQQYGLFDKVSGNSYLRNVNLVNPTIVVDGTASADTCFVGALCGQINPSLTEDEKKKLAESMLPKDLSETVKKALMEDILKGLLNSTSQIIGCRVENPVITVKGKAARVGGLCGAAGDKDEDGNYNAKIWDSYVSGGSIKVNEGNKSFNENVNAGGFCGLNNGKIERSYTTMPTVTALAGETNLTEVNKGVGFGWQGNRYTATDSYIKECYTHVEDAASQATTFSTTAWPGINWVTYTGRWPVYTNDWAETGGSGNHPATRSFWQKAGSAPSTYPILLWEDR